MSTLRPTHQIVAAVLARLKTVMWTGPNGPERAFADDAIRPFVGTDLNKAMQALLTTQTRAAHVVFDRNVWTDKIEGDSVRMTKSSRLWIVVSDRVIGDYVAALYGTELLGGGIRNPNSAPTPGALGLADLLIETMTGQLIDNPQGALLIPEAEDPAIVAVDQDKTPGRAAVAVQFRAPGGWFDAELTYFGPTT